MSEKLNEGDLLTKVALEDCQERLSFLITNGEEYDVSIFNHEGVPHAYRLDWDIQGKDINFHLVVQKVLPDQEAETVLDRHFKETIA